MGLILGTIYWPKENDSSDHLINVQRIAKKYNLENEDEQGYYKKGMCRSTYGLGGFSLLWNTHVNERVKNFLNDCEEYFKSLNINAETSFFKPPM